MLNAQRKQETSAGLHKMENGVSTGAEAERYAGKSECREVLRVCEKHGIPYKIVKESEL